MMEKFYNASLKMEYRMIPTSEMMKILPILTKERFVDWCNDRKLYKGSALGYFSIEPEDVDTSLLQGDEEGYFRITFEARCGDFCGAYFENLVAYIKDQTGIELP